MLIRQDRLTKGFYCQHWGWTAAVYSGDYWFSGRGQERPGRNYFACWGNAYLRLVRADDTLCLYDHRRWRWYMDRVEMYRFGESRF